MKRLKQIRDRQAAIRDELLGLEAAEAPTDEQVARSDSLLSEWDALEAEAAPLAERAQRLDAVRSAVLETPETSIERGASTPVPTSSGPTVIMRNNRDPFEVDFNAVRTGHVPASELLSRARDAVEVSAETDRLPSDAAEHATRLLDGKANKIGRASRFALAAHILRTGSEDYHQAFEEYMETGQTARAAMSLTGANGGYLVPFTFDPTIILTNSGSANPFRQLAEQKTTATNDWNGVTSAGVNAGWLGEGAVAPDASPTVGQLKITPQKAAAWLFGSYEVLEDSDIASSLPMLLADAKDRLEEAAFATGTGTGQPWGAVTRATTVASAGAAAYAVADVYAVQQSLPARFRSGRARPAWVANQAIINKTRQFDTAGGSSFWANLGAGMPERLLGAGCYESTTMVGTITTGSKNLLFGDWSQYLIVDRIGMSVLYEPMVKDTATGRPTGQGGWFGFWRVGGDVTTSTAFRVLLEG